MARRDSVLVSRSLYQIGIMTLVAAIVWVGVGVYLTITKSVVVEVDKKMIEPLVTTIDADVLEQVARRIKVDDSIELGNEDESTN